MSASQHSRSRSLEEDAVELGLVLSYVPLHGIDLPDVVPIVPWLPHCT